MDAYISDIETIAAYCNVKKFHLFGHSWGGLYAQIYAQKHPEQILSLLLCNPGSGTGNEWKQTEKEVLEYNKSKCTSEEWMKMGINSLLGLLGNDNAYKRLFKQVIKNYNKDFVKTNNVGIDLDNIKAAPINHTRTEILKYPLLKQIKSPDFPVTIIYGAKDIYKTSKEFVVNRYPTAKVWTIENCGHFPWLHNPAKFKLIVNQIVVHPLKQTSNVAEVH